MIETGILRGKAAIKLGDVVGSDEMLPAEYMWQTDAKVLARACLTNHDPQFPQRVRPGDFVIAGRGFGFGHIHMNGLNGFMELGVSAVIAESFSPGWYRRAIANGFLVITCQDVTKLVEQGDQLELNLNTGDIRNLDTGMKISSHVLHPLLREIIDAGGLAAYTRNRFAK